MRTILQLIIITVIDVGRVHKGWSSVGYAVISMLHSFLSRIRPFFITIWSLPYELLDFIWKLVLNNSDPMYNYVGFMISIIKQTLLLKASHDARHDHRWSDFEYNIDW